MASQKKPLKRRPSLKSRWVRTWLLVAGLVLVMGIPTWVWLATQSPFDRTVGKGPVNIVAVGDIACDPANPKFNGGKGTATDCQQMATSNLAIGLHPASALILGDLQYPEGDLSAFKGSYDPSWGRLKAISNPVPGNHEYYSLGAVGYYSYFGGKAGTPEVGYYSYDLGDWHIVALNSSCLAVLGCEVGSLQEQWLRRDLAAHPGACTLAYWHQPRFSSGGHGNDTAFQPLWQALQDYHADVVLSGHDHDYERFVPQRADGVADPNGIREFVVGTGGENLDPFRTIRSGSVVRDNQDFGVLQMQLEKSSYSWKFVTTKGGVVKDSGSAQCVTAAAGKSVIRPEPSPQATPGD